MGNQQGKFKIYEIAWRRLTSPFDEVIDPSTLSKFHSREEGEDKLPISINLETDLIGARWLHNKRIYMRLCCFRNK
jgi:hypothetical protein